MAQTLSSRRHWRHELSVLLAQSATPATLSPAPCASCWPNRGRSGVMEKRNRLEGYKQILREARTVVLTSAKQPQPPNPRKCLEDSNYSSLEAYVSAQKKIGLEGQLQSAHRQEQGVRMQNPVQSSSESACLRQLGTGVLGFVAARTGLPQQQEFFQAPPLPWGAPGIFTGKTLKVNKRWHHIAPGKSAHPSHLATKPQETKRTSRGEAGNVLGGQWDFTEACLEIKFLQSFLPELHIIHHKITMSTSRKLKSHGMRRSKNRSPHKGVKRGGSKRKYRKGGLKNRKRGDDGSMPLSASLSGGQGRLEADLSKAEKPPERPGAIETKSLEPEIWIYQNLVDLDSEVTTHH
ncbi:hypothetical protein QTO34_002658 [Cnephaeus nilssonii]|uniref:Spermatid nuclear transition protein 1 n=1 Tax=Cnephaeus nilssonii TaxID=3371016 RepID=A0AA40HSN6_CNENI|nr:hypothetical protein QTO34_002658 [Eptesicus nilssonii]